MLRFHSSALLALLVTATLTANLPAAGTVIGTAYTEGPFRVSEARVADTATLFEGALVETEQNAARLELRGASMNLGANSRARVSSKQALLEQGAGELHSDSGYALEARGLRVRGSGPEAVARVRLDGATNVLVAAAYGPVSVFNGKGLLVARVRAGETLSFEPQAGAADAFDIQGCLGWKEGRYIVIDQNGRIFEVRGKDFAALAGNSVRVRGKAATGTPGAGAVQIVNVESIEAAGGGGCAATIQQAGAQSTPPAGQPRSRGQAPGLGGEAGAAPAATKAGGKSHKALYAGVAVAAVGGTVGIILATQGKETKSPQ